MSVAEPLEAARHPELPFEVAPTGPTSILPTSPEPPCESRPVHAHSTHLHETSFE